MSTQIPDIKEKTGCVLAYMTLGIWGLIWLLISRTPAYNQKDFVRFHCFQSIFIGILYMFLPQGIGILFTLIMQVFSLFPGTGFIVEVFNSSLTIIQYLANIGFLTLIVYCVIFCLYGKYTNIPWVSQLINRMLR